MKPSVAALLTFSMSLVINTVVVAEPFNSRGQDYLATVQSNQDAGRSEVTISNSGFKNRGQNYLADAPDGSPAQEPTPSLKDKATHRWNS